MWPDVSAALLHEEVRCQYLSRELHVLLGIRERWLAELAATKAGDEPPSHTEYVLARALAHARSRAADSIDALWPAVSWRANCAKCITACATMCERRRAAITDTQSAGRSQPAVQRMGERVCVAARRCRRSGAASPAAAVPSRCLRGATRTLVDAPLCTDSAAAGCAADHACGAQQRLSIAQRGGGPIGSGGCGRSIGQAVGLGRPSIA